MANVPVPEPKSIRTFGGGQPEQVEDLITLRLDVTEVSMGGIVNLDLRRIAVVLSYLLKLVILPGNHASRIALHILARSRWWASMNMPLS
jgi:hypothetical protein